MNQNDAVSEIRTKAIFKMGKDALTVPPFLAARIAHEVRSRQNNKARVGFWRNLAFTAGGISLLLFAALGFILMMPKFEAQVGASTLLAIELRTVPNRELGRIAVSLPPGVSFVSEKYPEFNDTRDVVLELPEGNLPHELPFVVRSKERGIKVITITIFSRDGFVLEARSLKIRFS